MDAAVDNDLILKAVCYGVADEFWPEAEVGVLGILGAARYVVADQIKRGALNRDNADARSDLEDLLARCEALEPTEAEVALAADVELCGQELGLALDNGESQLAAITVSREIPLLETGDKRAIAGLEQVRHHLQAFETLRKRVRCLEQIALHVAPANVLRLGLHPRGLAPYIANLAHWRSHFLGRLVQQIAITGNSQLSALLRELSDYPCGQEEASAPPEIEAPDFLGPVRMHAPGGGEWSFFGMFASFDTPFEVTTSELALELLFPADQDTQRAFEKGPHDHD